MFSNAKQSLFPHKSLLLIFLLVLLVAIFSCGLFQAFGHAADSSVSLAGCDTVFSLTNSGSPRDNIFLGLFFLAFTLLALSKFFSRTYNKVPGHYRPTFIFNTMQPLSSIYDSIREAFRRGIIHTQIYNFIVIANERYIHATFIDLSFGESVSDPSSRAKLTTGQAHAARFCLYSHFTKKIISII